MFGPIGFHQDIVCPDLFCGRARKIRSRSSPSCRADIADFCWCAWLQRISCPRGAGRRHNRHCLWRMLSENDLLQSLPMRGSAAGAGAGSSGAHDEGDGATSEKATPTEPPAVSAEAESDALSERGAPQDTLRVSRPPPSVTRVSILGRRSGRGQAASRTGGRAQRTPAELTRMVPPCRRGRPPGAGQQWIGTAPSV